MSFLKLIMLIWRWMEGGGCFLSILMVRKDMILILPLEFDDLQFTPSSWEYSSMPKSISFLVSINFGSNLYWLSYVYFIVWVGVGGTICWEIMCYHSYQKYCTITWAGTVLIQGCTPLCDTSLETQGLQHSHERGAMWISYVVY